MTTLWKIISDQSSEYIMSIEDPEGWRSAEVKWDGCVHYYLYSNTPKGVNKANDDESEYIHICSIDEEIARLQALKRMAYNYFETSRGGDHYWHPDIVDGSAVTACAISSDEANMLQIAEAKQTS